MKSIKRWLKATWNTHAHILLTDISADVGNYRKLFPSLCLSVGLTFLLFISFALLITVMGFSLNIPIGPLHLHFAVAATMASLYLLMESIFKRHLAVYVFLVVFFASIYFLFSIKLSGYFYDLDYDSQWYHLEMVIALSDGWNPHYHQLSIESDPSISSQDILNSYPKAQEVVEAVICKSTGMIETAKSFNLITSMMAFCLVLSVFLRIRKLSPLLAIIGTLLLVANPITLIQYLSTYVDGSMYNLILSFLALLATFYLVGKNYMLIPIVLCISFLWNIKLTAVIFSTIFFVIFLVYTWYSEKVLLFFRSIQIYILAALVAFFVFGFHPFVTNTFWYGNPFYSDGGKDSERYIYINSPSSLYYVSSPERFILSIFSKPAVLRGENKEHTLKLPFIIYSDEFDNLVNDNTVSGFGPLFSGVFIISIVGYLLIFKSRHRDKFKWTVLFGLFVLFVSSVFFPVSSYARFIVPFWMFPCFVAIYLLSERRLLANTVGFILVAMMVANNFLITREYLKFNIVGTRQVREELSEIKKLSHEKNLAVDFDLFRSNRVRFKEAGIRFVEMPVDKCVLDKRRVLSSYIPESKTTLCYQF